MQENAGLPAAQSLQHQVEELREQAFKDALSGLLNRSAAEQYIKERLETMSPGDYCAMFIIDLDDFKLVNDTLGHQAGDEAIHQAAQILSSMFRASDIIGRLGGDEFIVFLSGAVTESLVRKKATAICKNLQMALGNGPVVNLTASVGVHIAAGNSEHFEGLYQSADLALYRAKKAGKHGFCVKHSEGAFPESEVFRPVNTIPLTGLLEYMDSGVALLEMGTTIHLLYVSPSFCRILGVHSQAFTMPKCLDELVHPDDRLGLEHALRDGLEKGCVAEYTHRVSSNGRDWSWWHIRAIHIEYNNPYPVMLVTTTDISQFKENERRLEEINQRLQVAFEQTTQGMWEVDIQTQKFSFFDHNGQFDPLPGHCALFPSDLITSGWIHPNSIPRFREFAKELLEGRVQGYGNFIVQDLDTGCYGWVALSYRTLFDEVGRPSKAVGIVENFPRNFVRDEARSVLKRPIPSALVNDLMAGLRANLTQDTVQELWVEGRSQGWKGQEDLCSQVLQRAAGKLFNKNEQALLAPYFQRNALLEMYHQGQRWISLEYQRVDAGGNIHRVNHVANLVEDPLTRDVFLFLYISQLDWRHDLEQQANGQILRDPATGLYHLNSVRSLAEVYLRRRDQDGCAVAVLQMGGLIKLYDGDPAGLEQGHRYLVTALSVALGNRCLLGQYSADQILIFFPHALAKYELRERLEEAFAFTRLVLAGALPTDGLRFVAGVVMETSGMINYSAMAAQASNLCHLWRSAASDTVAFPHEDDDWGWTELQASPQDYRVTVHHTEMERPLSEGEKDVAFHCVSAMLSADSLETSLRSVLNYIGAYYHADRVYILILAENRHAITMPYEWTSPTKHSIQQAVLGAKVDRFPILQRCIEEQAPVFLTRTQSISLQGEPVTERPWYFTAFPLIEKDTTLGFLCIENSQEHPADAALFSVLIPYILQERERFHHMDNPQVEPAASNLLALPNLRAYMEVIYTLNSDRYSAMGAVCLDIPNLSAINSTQGFEYGSKLLWYVAKTLASHFGPGWIFRTWDAEFVALCPNTTQQVFVGRCTRLRSVLQRRYPKELRMGYTWADGVFHAKTLVIEARALMRRERIHTSENAEGITLGSSHYRSISEAAQSGRIAIFLQPKIQMHTGTLFGAEALVRGIDEDGSILPPSHFIETLEQNGCIRDLDLYVLDRTLAIIDRWREQGLGIVPTSVNLSRLTLFSPTALASILAIQSRYPDIPAEALELEITESVGDVETNELRAVVDQFRQYGLRFSLDDFGSKYANLPIFTNVRFDTVKLDRSLITELADNPINRMLIQDIIQICQTCGMTCIAEGVENPEQISALQEIGCDYAQGFYYDQPIPADQFEQKYLRDMDTCEHTQRGKGGTCKNA